MPLTQVQSGMMDSTAQYYSFKNRIINGAMGIWQRGTSGFVSGAYSADRWVTVNTTSAAQNSDVPSSAFSFSLQFANSSSSFPFASQRIESVNAQDLTGQQVTLSFWAKNVSGTANLYCELYYPSAKDNFTSVTLIQAAEVAASPSSSWTYYTFTFGALPSQVANGLEVRIVRNNASAATTRITGVQLEKGSTATSFDYRPYGTELQLCQRYFFSLAPSVGLYNAYGSGVSASATAGSAYIKYPVTMRAAPTITSSNLGIYDLNVLTVSSLSADYRGLDSMFVNLVFTGSAAGRGLILISNNTLSSFINGSAEL